MPVMLTSTILALVSTCLISTGGPTRGDPAQPVPARAEPARPEHVRQEPARDASSTSAARKTNGGQDARRRQAEEHWNPVTYAKVLSGLPSAYYDPNQLPPRRAFLSALARLERAAPEVVIFPPDVKGVVRMIAARRERRIPTDDISDWMAMGDRLLDVLRWVDTALGDPSRRNELQYAAIKGSLQVLDPHTVFFTPEEYARHKSRFSGSVVGVGLTLGALENRILVREVLPKSPAHQAGIQVGDALLEIDGLELVNLTPEVAAQRLRGEADTQVTLVIQRQDQRMTLILTRAELVTPSVHVELLPGRVALVRVTGFPKNTLEVFDRAITPLRRQKPVAWILDLRGNEGGYILQAARMADYFLREGLICKAIGKGGQNVVTWEVEPQQKRIDAPLVVLVDRGTASAAEILAGTLSVNGRALLIGERTWGKGTVQKLFPMPDKSVLKLTMWQYMLAGDIPIQTAAIVPDVELTRVNIERGRMQLLTAGRARNEESQAHRIDAMAGRQPWKGRPVAPRVRYVLPAAEAPSTIGAVGTPQLGDTTTMNPPPGSALPGTSGPQSMGTPAARKAPVAPRGDTTLPPSRSPSSPWSGGALQDPVLELARQIAAAGRGTDRASLLSLALPKLESFRAHHESLIRERLTAFGVDWRPAGEKTAAPILSATLTANPAQPQAGQKVTLALTVENNGQTDAYRVGATISAFHEAFHGRELLFGHLAPGQRRTRRIEADLAQGLRERWELVRAHVHLDGHEGGTETQIVLYLGEQPRPRFRISWLVDDRRRGNGDGRLSPGERATLRFWIENIGLGTANAAQLDAVTPMGGLQVSRARAVLPVLPPKATARAILQVSLPPSDAPPGQDSRGRAGLSVALYDRHLGGDLDVQMLFRSVRRGGDFSPARRVVAPKDDDIFLSAFAGPDAPRVAYARTRTRLTVEAARGKWLRVVLPDERFAFVTQDDVSTVSEASSPDGYTPLWHAFAPEVILADLPKVAVDAELPVSGHAATPQGVRDLWVRVWNPESRQKDVYKVHYVAAPPAGTRRLSFATKVPLHPGTNYVVVDARDNAGVTGRIRRAVYRPLEEDRVTPRPAPQEPMADPTADSDPAPHREQAGCGCGTEHGRPGGRSGGSFPWQVLACLMAMWLLIRRERGGGSSTPRRDRL